VIGYGIIAALIVASIALGAVARNRWIKAIPPTHVSAAVIPRLIPPPTPPAEDSLAQLEASVVENDVFRFANRPASSPYDPGLGDALPGTPDPAPRAVRPTLILKAIVGGPPWQAVIEGFPGQATGVVARTGEKFDKLFVRSVTRDSVIVQAPDTTWILTFRKSS